MQRTLVPILERAQRNGFSISVQIDPPTPNTIPRLLQTISELKKLGVTLVDINSSRRISHDSIQLAVFLNEQGFEVIPHLTTRDSSLNGLANQMLAALELGNVDTFLIVTGDPHERDKALFRSRGVFQTRSTAAIAKLHRHFHNFPLTFAAAVNQNEPQREARRLKRKLAAGTDFFMSQPVFNETQLRELSAWYREYSQQPILIGIWPIVMKQTLTRLTEGQFVGVKLTDDTARTACAHSRTDAALAEWGVSEAEKLIARIRNEKLADGVYIVSPSRDPRPIFELLKKVL